MACESFAACDLTSYRCGRIVYYAVFHRKSTEKQKKVNSLIKALETKVVGEGFQAITDIPCVYITAASHIARTWSVMNAKVKHL